LRGFADIDPIRARSLADKHGGRAYASIEEALADPEVALVVNLTIHHAHYEVIKKCLEAGKHVYTEKPFALNTTEAQALIALATRKGLALFSAPSVYLGESQQAAWDILESGELGTVRLIFAEINHGRIERWHPNPAPFYQVGVLWDVAIYPFTLLTAFQGPVVEVGCTAQVLLPDRQTLSGEPFSIDVPDVYVVTLKSASGAFARVSANFYGKKSHQGSGVEFHADNASLLLESVFHFHGKVTRSDGQNSVEASIENPFKGVEFARGVRFMAGCIEKNLTELLDPGHALHVIEILQAADEARQSGQFIPLKTSFIPKRKFWPMP
jgi:predicted dehydrogenase